MWNYHIKFRISKVLLFWYLLVLCPCHKDCFLKLNYFVVFSLAFVLGDCHSISSAFILNFTTSLFLFYMYIYFQSNYVIKFSKICFVGFFTDLYGILVLTSSYPAVMFPSSWVCASFGYGKLALNLKLWEEQLLYDEFRF